MKYLPSFIRTLLPMLMGYLSMFAPVAEKLDVPDAKVEIGFATAALYYVLPRLGEIAGYKKSGILLGSTKIPSYLDPEHALIAQSDADLEAA